MTTTLGDLLFKIKGDNSQFNRSMDQAEGRAKSMADRVKGFIGGAMQHAVGSLLSTGVRTVVAATAKVVKDGISDAADYQQSLIETRTVAQMVGEDITKIDGLMAQVRAKSLELGKDATLPGVTPADVANTINMLLKGNLSLQQAIDASRGSLQLATLAQIGFGDAADMTSGILNMFSLSGTDASRVIDLIAGASVASSKSVGDMATGVAQGGFAFAAAKRPIEEYVTALTIATNAGLGGSDAGTALKNAMIRMMAPTKKARELMGEFGISFYDATGKMKPMPQIIGELNGKLKVGEKITINTGKATKKQAKEMAGLEKQVQSYLAVANDDTKSQGERAKAMEKATQASAKLEKIQKKVAESGKETVTVTDEMKNAFLETVFLSDGMKAIIPLLNAGAEGWGETEGKVTKAGAALELAGAKAKGTKGAWEGLVSTVQTAAQKLLEPFIGTDVKVGLFEKALRGVISWLDGVPFEKYADQLGRLVDILFTDPSQGGGLLGALKELGVDPAVIANLQTIGGAIKAAFDWIASYGPVVGEGLRIVGEYLGGAFRSGMQWLHDNGPAIWTAVLQIGSAFTTGFQWIVSNGAVIAQILQAIVLAIGSFMLMSGVASVIGGISAAVATLGATFTAAGGGIAGIVALLGGPVTVVLAVLAIAIGLLAAAWINNWGGIQEKTYSAGAAIQAAVASLTATLTGLWNQYGPTATRIWNQTWADIEARGRLAKANIDQIATLIKLSIEGKFGELGVQVGQLWAKMWNSLITAEAQFATLLINGIRTLINNAKAEFSKTDWSSVGRDLVAKVAQGVSSAGSMLAAAVSAMVNNALAKARADLAAFKAFVSGFLSGVSGQIAGARAGASSGGGSATPSSGGSAPRRTGINSIAATPTPAMAGIGTLQVGPNYFSNDMDVEEVSMRVARRIREAMS